MSSLLEFIKGSSDEFKTKVEWSKWSDLQSSTLVVSVATVLLALFTFGVDSVFRRAISNVLGMLIKLFNQ